MNECVVPGDMSMRDDAVEMRDNAVEIRDDAVEMRDDDAIDDVIARAAKEAIVQLPEIAKNEIRDAGSVQSLKVKNKTALNDISVCVFMRAGIQ